jgi:hypothetical protein
MRSRLTVLALALGFTAAGVTPAAAQIFNARATQFNFSGCDAHLCTTFTLFEQPSSTYAMHPPYSSAIGFTATHTFVDAGDRQGVMWRLTTEDYGESFAFGNAIWDGDQNVIGVPCYLSVFTNSGSCTDPLWAHSGWADVRSAPGIGSTVFIRYRLGPVGETLNPNTIGLVTQQTLTLTLTSIVPAVTAPEPATLALVAGGLLALGVGASAPRLSPQRDDAAG